jgi:hypothetical protein
LKIEKSSEKLGSITNIIVGIKPYQTGKGVPKQNREDVDSKKFTSDYKVNETYIQCINGSDFSRYIFLQEPKMHLSYGEWLAEPRNSAPFFDDEKLILRQTSDSIIANIDLNKRINLNNVYNIGALNKNFDLKYILTLINSKLLNLIYQNISQEKGRTFAEVKKVYLEKLPIRNISLKEQQPFIEKAEQMISLNKELQEVSDKFQRTLKRKFSLEDLSKKLQDWYNLSFADFIKELGKQKVKLTLAEEAEWEDYFITEQQKAQSIKNIITQTDKEIDQMVYELYGLTKEEIEIVERG